jgi:CsoR family transcriptional regulator, copper-sensing transcriptional repressor
METGQGTSIHACGCGCGTADAAEGRKAVGVDPERKDRNLKRLRRIEGQVRGLHRMVEGRELMRNHLRHCAAAAIRTGEESAETMYDELLDMMYKHSR